MELGLLILHVSVAVDLLLVSDKIVTVSVSCFAFVSCAVLFQLYRSAISMRADFIQAHINRGDILMRLNRY